MTDRLSQEDGGYKWLLAGFLFFASALNYADRTAITAVFPLLQKELGLSDLGLAAIGSAFLWSYAACSPFAGILADRLPRGRVVLFSLFAWSVVTMLSGAAQTPAALWSMRAALGVVESLYLPASIAVLAAHHTVATRATAIAIHLAGLSVGMVAGGTVSGYLATHYGWRVPLFALGGIGVAIASVGCFIVKDSDQQALSEHEKSPAVSLTDSLATLAQKLRNPAVAVLFFEIMIMGTGVWGLINWLPLYFHENFHMNLGKAALFGSVFLQTGGTLGLIVGAWPSDYLARRNISRRMMLFGCFYLAACPWMLFFLNQPAVWTISAAVFMFGLLRAMGSVNSNPLVCELLPPEVRSTALGFMNMLACIAGGCGVMVAGALKQTLGLAGVFAAITVVTGTCGAVILLVAWQMNRTTEPALAASASPGSPAAVNDDLCARDVT